MIIEGRFEVDAPREALYPRLVDPATLAACLPGCESIEATGPASYRAAVAVALGAIAARFKLEVEITEQTAPERVLSVTRGEEGGRASTVSAKNEVHLVALDGGRTEVRYVSDVAVTGRLGKFALGVMKKKAQAMGEEFASNLQARLRSEVQAPGVASGPAFAPQPASTPPVESGWWRRLLAWIGRWLRPTGARKEVR